MKQNGIVLRGNRSGRTTYVETPDEKEARIQEIEAKLSALYEEHEELQRKCDSEQDPKQRALYWTKMAMLDDAMHKLKNDLFWRKNTSN